MADITTTDPLAQLKSVLGNDADGFVEALAAQIAAKSGSASKKKNYPHSDSADELVANSNYSYARGRVYIGVDTVKAAANAIKNGEVTIVEAPEHAKQRGTDAYVVFPVDGAKGEVAIQPLYLPEEK